MVRAKKKFGPMKVFGSVTGARQYLTYFSAGGRLKTAAFSMRDVRRKK